MTRNKWHRTAFESISGDVDRAGRLNLAESFLASRSLASTKSSAARRTAGGTGPFYSCQTAAWDPTGPEPAATGREAREACEARLPETMRDRPRS